jgi:hypothetical protein
MADQPTADNATQQGPGSYHQPNWHVGTVNQIMGDQHIHKDPHRHPTGPSSSLSLRVPTIS